MSKSKTGGAASGGPSGPPRTSYGKQPLGASMLTRRIYKAVLDVGVPMTAEEIYEAVKDDINYTDTSLWWQRSRSGRSGVGASDLIFDIKIAGPRRVRERIKHLTERDILKNTAPKGSVARYTAGRPPNGWRYREPPYGWYELDLPAEHERGQRHIAKIRFLQHARAELAAGRVRFSREFAEEAVRLLES